MNRLSGLQDLLKISVALARRAANLPRPSKSKGHLQRMLRAIVCTILYHQVAASPWNHGTQLREL